jgi:hypothetical protein
VARHRGQTLHGLDADAACRRPPSCAPPRPRAAVAPVQVTTAMPARLGGPHGCRHATTSEEGHAMHARRSAAIALVLRGARMGLMGLSGRAPAPAQPTQTAAVERTCPDAEGTLQPRGARDRPGGATGPPHSASGATRSCSGTGAPPAARGIFAKRGSVWTLRMYGCRRRMRRQPSWPGRPVSPASGSGSSGGPTAGGRRCLRWTPSP